MDLLKLARELSGFTLKIHSFIFLPQIKVGESAYVYASHILRVSCYHDHNYLWQQKKGSKLVHIYSNVTF